MSASMEGAERDSKTEDPKKALANGSEPDVGLELAHCDTKPNDPPTCPQATFL